MIPCEICLSEAINEFKKDNTRDPTEKEIRDMVMAGKYKNTPIRHIKWNPLVERVLREVLIRDELFYRVCNYHRARMWATVKEFDGDLFVAIGELLTMYVSPYELIEAGLPREFVNMCLERYRKWKLQKQK